jgi:fucokinase
MSALEPLTYGQSLCGAGGGGFLVVVAKEGVTMADIAGAVAKHTKKCSVHSVTIDNEGMTTRFSLDEE